MFKNYKITCAVCDVEAQIHAVAVSESCATIALECINSYCPVEEEEVICKLS